MIGFGVAQLPRTSFSRAVLVVAGHSAGKGNNRTELELFINTVEQRFLPRPPICYNMTYPVLCVEGKATQ